MIALVIKRLYKKQTYTIGKLYVNGVYLCDTLEDAVIDLSNEAKVYGQTAIPYGSYKVILSISPKFKDRSWAKPNFGLVPEVLDVPHFAAIRIHPGSSAADTYGCPLVGFNKIKGGLVDSVKAYRRLMDDYLHPAHKRGEEITLTIE